MASSNPVVVTRATATPPVLAEGQNGVLSIDLAGNLRTSSSAPSFTTVGGAVTQGSNGTWPWIVQLVSGASSIGTVALTGTSSVSVIGTSLVSTLGTVPVTLSSTSLTGISAVSHVGTQPVSLQAATVASSVGTLTWGASNTAASLGTVQLGATVATASVGTVTLAANAASLGTVFVAGLQANDAVIAGNPIIIGGRAATATPTAVADNDAVYAQFDKYGRIITADAAQDLWGQGSVIIAASTVTTSVIAAGGANVKWAITSLGVTSTQTATTNRVDIIDGINNGGTLIHSFFYPAGISAQGGGTDTINFNPPWVCSANTAVCAKCSASVTDVRVVATAFKVL